MTRAAVGSLVVVLVGLGALAGNSSARDSTTRAKPRTLPSKEFKYVAEVRASYTIVVTDSASEMTGRTSMQVRYSAPLVITAHVDRDGPRIRSDGAPFLRPRPVGTIVVAVTGRDRSGCEFAFDRKLKLQMRLTADAFPQDGAVRLLNKPVRAGYELRLVAYAVGGLPNFTTACNLDERIDVLALRGVLQEVLWFDGSETAIAGAWSPASGIAAGAAGAWPFPPLVFQQVSSARPVKRAGGYRLPGPADRLASGKPLTITKSLARRWAIPGAPTVTKETKGSITFSFKP